jgi:hypothetical protein
LREAGFNDIAGRQDALNAGIAARTAFGRPVAINFELISESRVEVKIKIDEGSLKQCELLYDRIISKVVSSKGEAL